MLILRSSPASPFGRKVKIAAALLGLSDKIEVVAADTNDPNEPLRRQNPLGKIPTLVLENGEDALRFARHRRISRSPRRRRQDHPRRRRAVRGVAAAGARGRHHGCGAAAGLRGPVAKRGSARSQWVAHQADKVERGLAEAEIHHATPTSAHHIGDIALACALGYLDLRFEGRWRTGHPKLVAWLADFEKRVPAFAKTQVAA